MDLDTFKSLVDSSEPSRGDSATDVLAKIRECFTVRESDQALLDVRSIIDDLGLRFKCEQTAVEPYLGVALVLRQALIERGGSLEQTSNWGRAIQIAEDATAYNWDVDPEQQWKSNARVSILSSAINSLRKRGYKVYLPDRGGIDLSEEEVARIADTIEKLSASLGQALASSVVGAITSTYSPLTGRFKLGRLGQTVQLDAQPQIPFAYLYQLGLRYFARQSSAARPQDALNELTDLARSATALLDVSVDVFELMHARPAQIVPILKKSVAYDSIHLVTQVKPAHASEFVKWMLSQEPLVHLVDTGGLTSKDVLCASEVILAKCEKVLPHEFSELSGLDVVLASTLSLKLAKSLLRDVFSHTNGANKNLTFPPKDSEIDAAFRPLIPKDGVFCMQPPPMAARATVNAALDWCRRTFKGRAFDDEVLGPLFEGFVRAKLAQSGVVALHGGYKIGNLAGQCDAVVEAKDSIVFFELKSKMLTRVARSGDDIAALADIAQALVRPQAQALERHAVLREHGAVTLFSELGASVVELKGRDVLKVSVTRGDLGSLHDRPFLQHFLRAGCFFTFNAVDPSRQGKLDDLHAWFQKLKASAQRAGEADFQSPFPFPNSWSLSVFQLLLLLERTTDNESFVRELLRTRNLITPLRDFYSEYEFALSLQGDGANQK